MPSDNRRCTARVGHARNADPCLSGQFEPIPTPAANLKCHWPRLLILHGDFGGEQKCRGAVVELHQQHMPAKVIDFAHD
jgi:hypothetical protein